MDKPVKVATVVVVVALFALVSWQSLRPQEPQPIYQGKGLRTWLREYDGNTNGPAYRAVRQIGTNAIPALLNMLGKKDSLLIRNLAPLWWQHVSQKSFLPMWVRSPAWFKNRALFANREAVIGFHILGADAKPAIPGLITLHEQNISPVSQDFVSDAVHAIGPSAGKEVPSFFLGTIVIGQPLTPDAYEDLCLRWVWALSQMDTEAAKVVPVLKKSLSETNARVRALAAMSLGDFGPTARQSASALIRLLSDSDVQVRHAGAHALSHIAPELAVQSGAIPILVQGLEDKNFLVQIHAAGSLERLGADARSAVPALVASLKDVHAGVRLAAANALRKIDPQSAAEAGVK